MKKLHVCLIFCLLLVIPINLLIVNAQEPSPGLPPTSGDITPEKIEETQQRATSSWDYLSKEWKTILLKNRVIGFIDSILTKISFVFRILFGINYSLSLTLFIAIVIWIVFFIIFGSIIANFSSFSPWIARAIALILNVVLAQLGAFRKQAEFIIWLAFEDKSWWVSLIISIVIFAAIVLVIAMISRVGKAMKMRAHIEKVAMEETKLEGLVKAGEPISKALEKIK